MKPIVKQNLVLLVAQIAIWLVMMLAPSGVIYLLDPTSPRHWMFFGQAMNILGPMFVIYMTSFYLLVPYLFFRSRKVLYVVATLLLTVLVNGRFFFSDVSMLPKPAQDGYYSLMGTTLFIHLFVAFAALVLRSYLRSLGIQRRLEEEKRKSTEAELVWLKNQLNPHFLFNSLNNISSLTQIDPDQAQDAIAQLSDLLRYTLYESNKPLVPLAGEAEFMHNYIGMMKLRCSSMTTVDEDMATVNSSIQVAPLLFISFVENAFKHGTSNNQPSTISIRLATEGKDVVFECRNTNFPKSDTDRSGSGVGLENTRRRLDLLYPGRYEWKQVTEDGIYSIRIKLTF